jgi:hypothetical protein
MEIFIFVGFLVIQFTAHYGHQITGLAIFKQIGKLWTFQYVWEEFKDQPEKYELSEVDFGTPNMRNL